LTCVEPDPISQCGTGPTACGFCACGSTQLPDKIVPANLCNSVSIVPQGQCYSQIPAPLNCSSQACMDTKCDPTLNGGTGGCYYVPTVCAQTNLCYTPACIIDQCVPKAVCNSSIVGCCPTDAPTSTPRTPPPLNVTALCDNSTGGLGCGNNGYCNSTTSTCTCYPGYTGIICQFPPGTHECDQDSDCDDSNACHISQCTTNFTCVYTNVSCNTGNLCQTAVCDRLLGCQYVNTSCNDNNGCTDDYCDQNTGQCRYVNRSCSYKEDVCNHAYCVASAPVNSQCYTYSVTCPRDNNCTIAFCVNNLTDNVSGCTNTTLDCHSINIIGVAAGVAAGVIAAIAIGAICAAGLAGGGTYALANSIHENHESEVMVNPLYQGSEIGGTNVLHQV